jgi:cyclopropane fatty-acyl-phospholipid synthase-like methyltransferase
MTNLNDPLGQAILEYSKDGFTENIIVHSDLCDDDIMPVPYLFRTFEEMPEIEKHALALCKGEILEVGAGTGCHSSYLKSKQFSTFSIDTSQGSIDYLTAQDLKCGKIAFLDYNEKKFDTILILMNGLGLAGKLENVKEFLQHAKSLLKDGGTIITDSTDIRYLYEDDEGGVWMDLNSQYPGEMEFKMDYKTHTSEWFPWVYLDFENLENEANKAGLKATKILEDDNFHYLTTLEKI